ncbi:hypothetical protein [Gracilibacillus sp. YIM 98692]|uniref:DUF7210 family protein n=1 Tax=Gracilibacillus sp. YIM 98692 TaxID=2663532 RepID=UPI0013D022C4|nr:hypothetical protein [Gracilibacillus sp. YIM 98692]
MSLQTKERVRHNGIVFEPGKTIEEISEKDAKRLIDLGVAFFVSEKEEITENQEENLGEEYSVNAEEELHLIEYVDLKTVAKEVGLDFAGNISKKNLIDLIIEEEKVKEILDLTEDEE